jgi:hypothetical protein
MKIINAKVKKAQGIMIQTKMKKIKKRKRKN